MEERRTEVRADTLVPSGSRRKCGLRVEPEGMQAELSLKVDITLADRRSALGSRDASAGCVAPRL